MKQSSLGFGVVGSLPLPTVEAIAQGADAAGLATLWFNEAGDGDAIQRVAAAQMSSTNLTMGIGVINLDGKTSAQIIARIRELAVDPTRLILGVGASKPPSPLTTVREALSILKAELSCPVVVGSLGPRMRKLGAESGDGLLFNWLPPEDAAKTTHTLREQAAEAGNPNALAATYVRTALGPAAFPVLESEAAKYSAIPSYAANFGRLGISAMQGAVYGPTPEDIQAGLLAFDGTVDHLVVRAITGSDDAESYLALIEALSPLAR